MARTPAPKIEVITLENYIEILTGEINIVHDRLVEAYRAVDTLRSTAYGSGGGVVYEDGEGVKLMVPKLVSEAVSKLIIDTGNTMGHAGEIKRTFDWFNEAS